MTLLHVVLTLATVHKYTNLGHNIQSYANWMICKFKLSGCIIGLNWTSILFIWYVKVCDHVL